ncbi:MAG: hypothetical protein ATN32_09655 [Candidatus Epulonipiscium fishelsonii]|nr:MAG: hypothetical protein ATN32_09655 [Epulopiscium sp. AS2M-Bin002]
MAKVYDSFLGKHVLIYTFFCWFIVLILVMSLYIENKKRIDDQHIIQSKAQLYNVMDKIDTELMKIHEIKNEITIYENTKKLDLKTDVLNVLEFQRQIDVLRRFSPITEEIFVYIEGSQYIYSNASTYTEKTFEIVQGIDLSEITSSKEYIKNVNFKTEMLSGQKMLIIYPLLLNGKEEVGTISFILSNSEVKQIINELLLDENIIFLIMNGENILWQHSELTTMDLHKLQSSILDKSSGNLDFSMNKDKKSIVFDTSNNSNLKNILGLSNDIYQNKIQTMRWIYILLSIIIMSASGSIIYYTLRRIYKPLENIKPFLNENEIEGNKFGQIEQAMNQLQVQNHNLNKQIKYMFSRHLHYMYFKLLNGILDSEVKQVLEAYSVKYTGKYRVIIIKLDDQQKSLLIDQLREVFNKLLVYVETELDHIVIVINSTNDGIEQLNEYLQKIVTNRQIIICIGKSYFSWTKIYESYKEASEAMKYRCVDQEQQIIFYENKEDQLIELDDKLLMQLRFYIGKSDMIQIENQLNLIIDTVGGLHLTYKDLIQIIVQIEQTIQAAITIREYGYLMKNKLLPTDEDKLKTDSQKKFNILINNYLLAIENMLIWKKERITPPDPKNRNDLYMDIINYFHQNYSNSQLSIQEIAEASQMAMPNLTTYFKKRVGATPKEYLTTVRMDKAKELLRTSNDSIDEITSLVGYTNTSSFIRQFKKVEGITPGEYRKSY